MSVGLEKAITFITVQNTFLCCVLLSWGFNPQSCTEYKYLDFSNVKW